MTCVSHGNRFSIAHKRVYAYELLFRSGVENACPPTDGTAASRHVLHVAWLDLGLATLTGPKPAFVNFTQVRTAEQK